MNLTLRVPLESFVKLFREMGVLEYRYFVKHSIQVANITTEIVDRLKLPLKKMKFTFRVFCTMLD